MLSQPKVFIIDVDGVMTTGQFFYSAEGKVMKAFGPDDCDALSLLTPSLDVQFITGDGKGFDISKRRIVDDMKLPLTLVSAVKRLEWIQSCYPLEQVIYMGDGIFDHYVMRQVRYGIAPMNADPNAKKYAHYITQRKGGDRAVAEACLHILEKFFEPYDPEKSISTDMEFSNQWSA